MHLPFGMQALRDEFQMAHHLTGSAGGGGHQVMRLAQARAGAIVHDETILAQHQPIAHLTDLQGIELVRINQIEQLGRIRPLNVDLA